MTDDRRLSPEAEAALAKYRPGYVPPPEPVTLWKRIKRIFITELHRGEN